MHKRSICLTALVAGALCLTAYTYGGWAVITVDDVPEYVTVDQPVKISFAVRQHGLALLPNLRAEIVATDAKSEVRTYANSVPNGRYAGSLVVPHAGPWTITIHSGFGKTSTKLYPVQAIAAGAAPPAPTPAATRGQRLFVAKGCVTCHVHGNIEGSGLVAVGPNLTPKRYVPEHLAKLLADPASYRTPGQQAQMPDLGLKPAEISALVAFINADRNVSAR